MAFDSSLRIGAGTLEEDVYGGDFTQAVDLGKTKKEEGIVINYSADIKKVGSAQDINIDEVFLIAEEMTIEAFLKTHLLENIARSFGNDTTVVVDNATATPKYKELEFGGARTLPIRSYRFKIPQPKDSTLFDIIVIYRGLLIPTYSQTFRYDEERYTPIKIECLGDPNNGGKIGYFRSEYV